MPQRFSIKGFVVRDDGYCAGESLLADPPNMQIGDPGVLPRRASFDGLADLFNHGVVHFPVKQNGGRFLQ